MLRDEIIAQGPDSVLAFAMEPVGGASTGALVAPDSYYARVREICDEFGVLLIMDEVMSGVGRTGRFLASEHWHIRPDLVALSKGFGAGYAPLGAMIADEGMVDTVLDAGGFAHGHTYAGNPFEMVADRETMAPLPKSLNAYERFVDICYDRNLITYSRRTRGGVDGDHFLICPPMIVTEPQIGEILSLLDDSLKVFARESNLEV